MIIDRRLIKNFDFFLLLLMLALCTLGMLVIYSATHSLNEGTDALWFVKRQALSFGIGMGLLLLVCFIDYINFSNWARYLYGAGMLLLILVLLIGETRKGATRWIPIGFFVLQPSEVAKLVMIIVLAKLLADKDGKISDFLYILRPLLATLVMIGLIIPQPDLGTAMVFIALLMGMFYTAGVHRRFLVYLCLAGVIMAVVMWFFFLEDYQKDRLTSFFNPEGETTDARYQLLQSMIAVGSGGLFGKGFMDSTQVRLQFLPEPHTDFIFSVLAEELGFAGSAGLLLLFFLLIYRILWIATHSKDQFGALLCTGVAIMFTFQALVNVGMTIGIMPITGMPLPFISYGNNALLVNMMSIGLVLNVGMRRHKIQF